MNTTSAMIRHEFRAMNTDCHVLVHPRRGAPDIVTAETMVRDYEERFSRFLPDSDLSRLNSSPSEEVHVSRELAAILDRSLRYAMLTDGVFDPVVLRDLVAAGYDRSFEQVPASAGAAVAPPGDRYDWTDIFVDSGHDIVYRTPEAGIDLGGIAKGAAADAAAALFAQEAGALISLGGDIRAIGRPDDADAWHISLEDGAGMSRGIVRLADNALATSSVQKRSWVRGGEQMHHLINPRTGGPAASDAVQCSVLADTAEHADVAAKVGLILGVGQLSEDDPIGRALGLRGVAWITTEDAYTATEGWRAACR